jgi:hypothetical protein
MFAINLLDIPDFKDALSLMMVSAGSQERTLKQLD